MAARALSAAVTVALASVACAPAPVAPVAPPLPISTAASPWLATFDDATRAALAASMARGGVVFRYDAAGLTPLPRCVLPGAYEYVGHAARDVLLDAPTAAAVALVSPAPSAAAAPAALRARATYVGRRVLDRHDAPRGALTGACAGATHVARAFDVGAFAAAPACERATPDDERAPTGCDGPVRALLTPLDDATFVDAASPACPGGTSPAFDWCVAPFEGGRAACVAPTDPACGTAAAAGDPVAARVLAVAAWLSSTATEARDRARARMADACRGGDPAACALGATFAGAAGDDSAASTLALAACDGGDPDACVELGMRIEGGEPGPDASRVARRALARGCAGGSARACGELAFMSARGLGGPTDLARATELWQRDCHAGHWLSCGNVGVLEERAGDVDAARAHYESACAHDDARGCTNLGTMLERGLGGPSDYARAGDLYERSCDDGDAEACAHFAHVLRAGLGRYSDRRRAAAIEERACELGRAESCPGRPEPRGR